MAGKKGKAVDKLILISDIHFGVRNDSAEWLDNIASYFNNFFIPLVESKKKEKVAVCVLGDLFDNRQSVNIGTMNIAYSIISRIAELAPVYIMAGNHDMFRRNDSSLNSLVVVQGIPNVTIVDKEEEITFTTSDGTETSVLFIPYTGIYSKETKSIVSSDADYIFLHTEVVGAIFDSGRPIKDGAMPTATKAKRIFSGHIHKRQEMDKFIYIGSPYHLRRSDMLDEKGIYTLTIATDHLEFTPNLYSPIYQGIGLDGLLLMTLSEFKTYIANNYTDVIIPKSVAGSIEPYELLSLLDRYTYKDIHISVEKIDKALTVEVSGDAMPISSLEEVSYKYIEELDATREDKDKLMEMLRAYMDLAKEKVSDV